VQEYARLLLLLSLGSTCQDCENDSLPQASHTDDRKTGADERQETEKTLEEKTLEEEMLGEEKPEEERLEEDDHMQDGSRDEDEVARGR